MIRRAFAATFFQRRRRRSSRAAGHVANEQVMFAQAVAAGAGTNIASPTLTVRKPSPHIPSMKQLQMKMQEYNTTTRAGNSWHPGIWPQAEDHHRSECTIENLEPSHGASTAGESVENLEARLDQSSPTVAQHDRNLPNEDPFAKMAPNDEDEDAGAPSVELIDMRRKKGCREGFQTPKGRAHKKLRSRRVHKLTLLAPETALMPFTELSGTTSELAKHLAGLSVVEAGPSAGAAKNESNESSESTANEEESSREKCEDGFSDAEARGSEPPVVTILETINTVEGVEENKYPYYRSISGSSTSFCTPEIEDWGNLK